MAYLLHLRLTILKLSLRFMTVVGICLVCGLVSDDFTLGIFPAFQLQKYTVNNRQAHGAFLK